MNIWYLSAYDQPKGQSSRTYDFAMEMVKRGHQVTMFTNSYCHWTHNERLSHKEKWRVEEIDGIRVVWLKTFHYDGNGWRRGVNMLFNIWRIFQFTRKLSERPDVVIGPSVPLGTGWIAQKIAQKTGAAFVYEIRDVWPIALVYNGGLAQNSFVYYTFRFIEKSLYRRAQRISSALPFVLDHVTASGGNPNKVSWIPNGVNFDRFAGYRGYDGGANEPLVVMYIGGFGVAHDVVSLVRAAKILQEKGNNSFRFVIIGDGPKKAECLAVAAQNGLENIEFRDPIPKAAIPKVQMQSDILVACVLDSQVYRFGLNLNKIYDYFASERPVIFSGTAPNDPVAETGAGFSVPPEQPEMIVVALEKFQELSPEVRVEMGKKGRQWVEDKFDMQILGNRMETLLRGAIRSYGEKK